MFGFANLAHEFNFNFAFVPLEILVWFGRFGLVGLVLYVLFGRISFVGMVW